MTNEMRDKLFEGMYRADRNWETCKDESLARELFFVARGFDEAIEALGLGSEYVLYDIKRRKAEGLM